MARSNKPILWLPFAGGGLVAALLTPVLILITGVLMPLGLVHLHYETIAAFAHNPIGKLLLLGAVALDHQFLIKSAEERLFTTFSRHGHRQPTGDLVAP
jgi:fumarate reductase subunit D